MDRNCMKLDELIFICVHPIVLHKEKKMNLFQSIEPQVPCQSKKDCKLRSRSATTSVLECWDDASVHRFLRDIKPVQHRPSPLTISDNYNSNVEICMDVLDRDELLYFPQQITPELEAAFIRFCRFSRTLILRNFEQRITSVDFKAFCGDLLVADAAQALNSFNYNVVDAFYYLQNHDLQHAWGDGRLDKEKLKAFENYISQNGFDSGLTKIINFENKRRDLCVREPTKASYIYLFNYYQSWKRTHNGSKVMEKFYRIGQKENDNPKQIFIESKFKSAPILCQYCEKADFQAGKTNKIMCKKCYEFFNLVDEVRSVTIDEAVTLAPIEFKWDCYECYEPEVTRRSKRERKPRTRSATTSNEYYWSGASARKFGKFITAMKKRRQRVENCRSNLF